ncbi:hypothetical protein Pmar_PMAR018759 [Perkinsus marinus ATCC 50983]|uniref:Uncharacterized protein n=1 Tax=Perkinsus marinus (strain ATCC 50983 / TXsc) TaxID=423536 RepID=C5KJA6_PERM5|nr:hypothetical protein Pmar_PMAR018759 [Perkinsus marinus ATCC 50983]EER15408.1 hypothetical protein Pmar_PMAR018759 [Perkinsus marinus ATCC 50983]|eukprot:XP_002783612.1 hypothetical protein Pmar_PMAR018759 [Perkinsus marinus ATCC 50983]
MASSVSFSVASGLFALVCRIINYYITRSQLIWPFLDRICGGLYAITSRTCGNFNLRHGRSSSEITPSETLYDPSTTARAQAESRAIVDGATDQAASMVSSAKRELEGRSDTYTTTLLTLIMQVSEL